MNKLFQLTGFIAFILIIFLNAFVDLGHKILIQNTVSQIMKVSAAVAVGLTLLITFSYYPAGSSFPSS